MKRWLEAIREAQTLVAEIDEQQQVENLGMLQEILNNLASMAKWNRYWDYLDMRKRFDAIPTWIRPNTNTFAEYWERYKTL